MRLRTLALFACFCPALLAAASLPFRLTPAFPGQANFKEPVQLVPFPDRRGLLYVVQQAGVVAGFHPSEPQKIHQLFDLSKKVRFGGEEGLLSLAFHPKAWQTRKLYVVYTVAKANPRKTRVSELTLSKQDPLRAEPASERVLFEVPKNHSNHNGATLVFGPDGYLYISLGDGGGWGDQDGNAQDLGSLLGKVLRLDVDRISAGLAYGIPPDNPFVKLKGSRPEVWAYGLRNSWRMSFDSATGALWAGDVGQDKYEEVDVIVKGGNYGWNWREGKHPYDSAPSKPQAPNLIEPVVDYARDGGSCITGGMVYRQKRLPALSGRYLYADFVSKKVWAVDASKKSSEKGELIAKCPQNPSSFGTDLAGEAYVVGYDGTLYKFEANN